MSKELTDLQGTYSELWRTQKKGVPQENIDPPLESQEVLRVGAYVRLSPTGEEREEGSLVSHPQRIQEFIEWKNKQVERKWGEISEWYVDKDQSGKDLNRPNFQKLCRDIKAGLIDVVIVTELSRLSRRVKDFCHIWDFLKEHNVKFMSLKENFDTSTPMGELMLIQAISFAQFERETIVGRIKNGARARAERGLAGGGLPLGFDLVPGKPNHRQVNEDERALVQFIFKKMLELKRINKLSTYLNENGYQTKRYVTQAGKQKGGHRWVVSSLHTLLTNRAYIGQREFNKKNRTKEQSSLKSEDRYFFTDAQWPAIVDEKDFFDVQRLLEYNKKKSRKYTYHYRLTGLVKCVECGASLIGKSATGRKMKYFYYGHKRLVTTTGNEHLKKCYIENIPAPQLEELVLERLKYLAQDQDLLASLVKESHASSCKEYNSLKSLIQSAENQRKKAARQLERVLESIIDCSDKTTRQLLQKKVPDLEAKRLAFEKQVQELRSQLKGKESDQNTVSLSAAFTLLKNFRKNIDKQPLATQCQILEHIIKEIVVYQDKVVLKLYGASNWEVDSTPDGFQKGTQSLSQGKNLSKAQKCPQVESLKNKDYGLVVTGSNQIQFGEDECKRTFDEAPKSLSSLSKPRPGGCLGINSEVT